MLEKVMQNGAQIIQNDAKMVPKSIQNHWKVNRWEAPFCRWAYVRWARKNVLYVTWQANKNAKGKFYSKGDVVLSFPPSLFDNFHQNRSKMSKIDHKWVQSGPGRGGRGTRKSTKIWKSKKNANVKKHNKKINKIVLRCGAIFSKIGGLNGWVFIVVLSTNVIQMTYKT